MRIRQLSERGISMLEMMIVVIVIGIMATIAAPSFDNAIQQIKFKNVGRSFVNAFRLARASAVSLQEPHGVFVDESTGKVITFIDKVNIDDGTFDTGDSVIVTDSIEISFDSLFFSGTFVYQPVVFYPDGSASSSGDIYCNHWYNGVDNSFSVYVTAATGHARLDIYEID